MLTLRFQAGELKLSEVFEVSSNARILTEIINVEIMYEGKTGYGQASFPPYMKEKREVNLGFLSRLDLQTFNSPFHLNEIHRYMDSLSSDQRPAKAAIDMALYDLMGKISGLPVYQLLGLETSNKLYTSLTIGIGQEDFIRRQLEKAKDFTFIKVKLGGNIDYNKHVIELIREHASQPIGVDFNQGIEDKEAAIDMIEWLSGQQVKYAEQPMPVSMEPDYAWLKSRSPLDIYGDESIQTASDIINKHELFHGVNIKLMKCGGISKAYEMVRLAQNLGLKTMLGCMVESTCAITAAAHLGSLFDRLDLDGHLNIADDPYKGIDIQNGELLMPEGEGLGVSAK